MADRDRITFKDIQVGDVYKIVGDIYKTSTIYKRISKITKYFVFYEYLCINESPTIELLSTYPDFYVYKALLEDFEIKALPFSVIEKTNDDIIIQVKDIQPNNIDGVTYEQYLYDYTHINDRDLYSSKLIKEVIDSKIKQFEIKNSIKLKFDWDKVEWFLL